MRFLVGLSAVLWLASQLGAIAQPLPTAIKSDQHPGRLARPPVEEPKQAEKEPGRADADESKKYEKQKKAVKASKKHRWQWQKKRSRSKVQTR